jgi:prepilin-type N-terminal cleavage/methylation domain-containing protein
MRKSLRRYHCFPDKRGSDGFSLIELLVVIAIVALLVAIAIPQFFAYKARSIDARMKSDLKNGALAMEAYYAANKVYPTSLAALTSSGFTPSTGDTLAITITSTSSFTLTAASSGGTQASYTLNSVTGSIN